MDDNSKELAEELVFQWLPLADVDVLAGLCDEYRIVVSPNKVGKKPALLKLVLRYLNSETVEDSEDGGKALFVKLQSELTEIFEKKRLKSEAERTSVSDGDGHDKSFDKPSLHTATSSPHTAKLSLSDVKKTDSGKITVQRLREFKINGIIGAVDQKDSLTYTSLSFQMERGKKAGYTVEEIQLAVIKAIRPGSSLRIYLESKGDIVEYAFIKILRSHYKEKDSTSVFQEMSNSVQSPSESELDFCLRVMSLREKVLTLSREESCPFDETLVRKRFFHAVFTGLKHNTMRLELKKILTTYTVSDEELLQEISSTASIELEHLNKFNKNKIIVNEIRTEKSDFRQLNSDFRQSSEHLSENSTAVKSNQIDKKTKENLLLAEIKKLSVQVSELSSIREEVSNLKKQIDGHGQKLPLPFDNHRDPDNHPSYNYQHRPRRLFRCRDCERVNNSFCNHCFLCGSTEHRKNECRVRNPKND